METPAGDERTKYILQKKYNSVGCLYCKDAKAKHTHLTCPKRPCYLCKNTGHLSNNCPHRLLPGSHEAALKALLAARKKRSRPFHFLRNRELDPSPTRVNPALLYFPNEQFGCRASLTLNRVHGKRITTAEWHPQGKHFVTADKAGAIRVWCVGDVLYGEGELGRMRGNVAVSYLHHCNVNVVAFDRNDDHTMYTSSSDGIVCMSRLTLMGSAPQQESLEECAMDRDVVLNMNPEGWNRNNFRMAYGMAHDADRKCLYVGASNGQMWRIDLREGKHYTKYTTDRFHKDKVTCIDINPRNANLLATASNDKKVCLWDARKFASGHELGCYEHGRVVSSAYFSPNTGARLLTTSLDNRLRIWNDIYGFSGDVNTREDATPIEIVHSHDFHRYLNPFRATWDPKDWQDDLFVCGRFLGDAYYENGNEDGEPLLLHPIDMFSAKAGSLVHSLVDPATTLICTTNKFSPVCDMILTTASANVILWKKREKNEREGKGSALRGGRSGFGDDGEDDDDDDDDDGGGDEGTDSTAMKRRKLSAIRSMRSRRSTVSTGKGKNV